MSESSEHAEWRELQLELTASLESLANAVFGAMEAEDLDFGLALMRPSLRVGRF